MRRTFLFSLVATLALVLSLSGSAAAEVPDQSAECLSGSSGNLAFFQPIGQTFRPLQDALEAVEFRLAGYATGTATITIDVREDDFAGTVIGTTSELISLTDNVQDWYRFEFSSPLAVTPGETYLLAISVDNNSVGIPGNYCPSYTRGQAWSSGVANTADFDFNFRTFGPCGNGTIDSGEDCDEEAFAEGCCDFPSCQFVAADVSCPSANLCINAACDGAGQCLATNGPLSECGTATRASLSMKSSTTAGKSKVKFKWTKGTLDDTHLGTSITGTDYALCVYDGTGPVVSGLLPANGEWSGNYPKLSYKDKTGATGGVTAITLKRSDEALKASASAALGGTGLSLSLSSALTPPVVAQLRTSAGGCWGASYDSTEIKKNDGKSVTAKEKNELP